jgi:hypothetical protein
MRLTRADLVRAAVAELREAAEVETHESRAAAEAAKREFVAAMRAEVLVNNAGILGPVFDKVGTTASRCTAEVVLELTDDVLSSPPLGVEVVLRDGDPWDARIYLRFRTLARERELDAWVAAEKRARAASSRSTKLADVKDDAAEVAVAKLLDSTDKGKQILALLRELNALARDAGDE